MNPLPVQSKTGSPDDFEDFFERSLCGLLTANSQGKIIRCNVQLSKWLGYTATEITERKFSDLLSIGSKIYYETILAPMLKMNGLFDEVALELSGKDGQRVPVLANAYECPDENNQTRFLRFTLFKATDRRRYEQNLQGAKAIAENSLLEEKEAGILREQFIAVLGHDLRNPLSAIITAASVLAKSELSPRDSKLLTVIKKSGTRMSALIADVLDFARVRLGGGIIMNRQLTDMEPVLLHVVDELRTAWPQRQIESVFKIEGMANCDAARISQLLSNLLANALMHGSTENPVGVYADFERAQFTLWVTNQGKPIPKTILNTLFQPFKRETSSPSQHGLGLGLYIASEIARAHGGTLTAESDDEETKFTFHMPA